MKQPDIAKYARQATRARLIHLRANLRHAAKHPHDPEAIHDLRVSIRRLTQCFRIFRAPVKKLRRRLHKIMEHCGAVRNCDIALDLLAECGLPESPTVLKLKEERDHAARKLHRYLKKERRRHQRAAAGPSHPGWQIATLLPNLADDFFASGDAAAAPGSSYHALHRFRLRAKRFRYTLELFESFYEGELTIGAKALKGVQDRLGAINDCVTSIDLLVDDPAAVAAIEGLLRERTRAFHAFWRTRFSTRKRAWWQSWLAAPRLKAASIASSGSAKHPG